jgi:hypothetical protein
VYCKQISVLQDRDVGIGSGRQIHRHFFSQYGSRLGLISDAVCACLHYVVILGLQTKARKLNSCINTCALWSLSLLFIDKNSKSRRSNKCDHLN